MTTHPRNRFNETWHRLRDWDGGQTKSEMLAWQVIAADGYTRIDPSHPRGGPDGGKDAVCERDGERWVMAVFFPDGKLTPAKIKNKLAQDMKGAKANHAVGIAFVTNQEVLLADREAWEQLDPDLSVDIFHLERITRILNEPQYAQTREEFLDIVAGPPPMLVKASVDGTAHRFTNDQEVFEVLVQLEETRIRRRSEKAHARVKAEEEQRRREAAARPYDLGAQVRAAFDTSQFVGNLVNPTLPRIPGMPEPPPEPEPLSEAEIVAQVAEFRESLTARWPACRDYLAGVAWPGLHFRIQNEAKSFLTDVEVILTFHGARGIDWDDRENFEFERVKDPSWQPYRDPLYYTLPPMQAVTYPDSPYKVRHNDLGDLTVKINLASLRPHPEWRSDEEYDDEVVLIVDPDRDLDEVEVTYTVTAESYGEHFEGEPIRVPVTTASMRDVIRELIDEQRSANT